MPHFDLFIIGGGPAGQHLARTCRAAGMSVGITEYRGYGGACGLRGCDPKRVMVGVAEAVDGVDRLADRGLCGRATVEWGELVDFVGTFVDDKPADSLAALRDAGITAYTGRARFTGERSLRVEGHTEEDDAPRDPVDVTAEHVVIATGQRPRPLEVPGAEYALTSADFHRLPELPRRLLFAGGGYIALESAHIARRCGAEITIVNDDDEPLAAFDPDLVGQLLAATEEMGVEIVTETSVTAIVPRAEGGFRVTVEGADGSESTREVDLVFNTSGRVANFEGLDLEAAGIGAGADGIPVDEHFRVAGARHVYAIGDCADGNGPPLTPVANADAAALAETLTTGQPTEADYDGLCSAVYCLPELAMVGLTEGQAAERGLNVEVTAELDFGDAYHARRTNARAYGYKTLVDRDTGKLVGAHLLGPRASEVINVFALAIRAGLGPEVLRNAPWAYPSWAGDVSKMVG